MRIHDVSRPLTAGIPVWPGDTPYDFGLVARMAEGASVNVGRVVMSTHTGAHTDAPLHFSDAGADMAAVSLVPYLGPCVLADVRPGGPGGVRPEHLPAGLAAAVARTRRLLLRSYARRPAGFDQGMTHATVELADWLAAQGALLFGIDTDSMDAFDSRDLPAHRRLTEHGIAILEGLDLAAVAPGEYDLVALPLRLVGGDASPVRAVLIERS